jgi:hypothetical protein
MRRSKKKNRNPLRQLVEFIYSEREARLHRMLFGETEQEKAERERQDRAFAMIHGSAKKENGE